MKVYESIFFFNLQGLNTVKNRNQYRNRKQNRKKLILVIKIGKIQNWYSKPKTKSEKINTDIQNRNRN